MHRELVVYAWIKIKGLCVKSNRERAHAGREEISWHILRRKWKMRGAFYDSDVKYAVDLRSMIW